MAHDTSIIEAMRLDGRKDAFHHWWDNERDLLEKIARAVMKTPSSLDAQAIKATDHFMDTMVYQAEEAWRDSTTERERAKWTQADVLAAYRDGAIDGVRGRIGAEIERLKDEDEWSRD